MNAVLSKARKQRKKTKVRIGKNKKQEEIKEEVKTIKV
jgi:hypothetical protein